MQTLIDKTQVFLYETLKRTGSKPKSIEYRYKHSLRVANIGLHIAEEENANKKIVVLGCLLHDLGKYCSHKGIDHGRKSAEMARPFLQTLDLNEKEINDICYSVAIHVDGKAGYEYEDILEGKIISDSDNVDRFSSSKILMSKSWDDHIDVTVNDEISSIKNKIERLNHYSRTNVLDTRTGNKLFKGQIDMQLHFYESLLKDLLITNVPEWI